MPNYLFTSQTTGETREFFYHMRDVPKVSAIIDIDGEKWRREMTMPQAAPNGIKPLDPHSAKQFVAKTGAMKGTIGDMLDLSKEMSEKRAEKHGEKDPIKEKFYDDYAAKRRGIRHTAQLAERQKSAQKKLEKTLASLGLATKTI